MYNYFIEFYIIDHYGLWKMGTIFSMGILTFFSYFLQHWTAEGAHGQNWKALELGSATVLKMLVLAVFNWFQCLFLNKVVQLFKAPSHSQWTSTDLNSASLLWSNRTLSHKLTGLWGNPQTYTYLLLSVSLTFLRVTYSMVRYCHYIFINYFI